MEIIYTSQVNGSSRRFDENDYLIELGEERCEELDFTRPLTRTYKEDIQSIFHVEVSL